VLVKLIIYSLLTQFKLQSRWVPIFGWIMWFLGLVFSFCGLFKQPRGLAIAGLVISLIGLIILIVVIGALGAFILGSSM